VLFLLRGQLCGQSIVLARELRLDPYAAAKVAEALRRQLVQSRESFVTVFSDPVATNRLS